MSDTPRDEFGSDDDCPKPAQGLAFGADGVLRPVNDTPRTDEFCPYCNPCRRAPEITPLEDALRSLASWLGVGGYNAPTVDAAVFEAKIRDGVDGFLRAERTRAEKAERELAVAKDSLVNAKEALEACWPNNGAWQDRAEKAEAKLAAAEAGLVELTKHADAMEEDAEFYDCDMERFVTPDSAISYRAYREGKK